MVADFGNALGFPAATPQFGIAPLPSLQADSNQGFQPGVETSDTLFPAIGILPTVSVHTL